MADLGAVLRKTIDALPSASPQLRAKVYEKARAAIQRQIASADPPLSEETIEARQLALEDAITSTEAHYGGANAPAASATVAPRIPPAATSAAPAATPSESQRSWPASSADARASDSSSAPAAPPLHQRVERHDDLVRPAPAEAQPSESVRAPAPSAERDGRRDALRPAAPFAATEQAASEPADVRIGEVGPMSEPPPVPDAEAASPSHGYERNATAPHDPIPRADLTTPSYSPPRRRSASRAPLLSGIAALLFVGVVGAVGYIYSDEIRSLVSNTDPVAATDGTEAPSTDTASTAPDAPVDAASETAAATEPAAPDPTARQFTQRLLADGSEIDEGPAASSPNAFDEGTDVASATPIDGGGETTAAPAAAPGTETATAPAAEGVAVGQRAVFYEEGSTDRPGSQQGGNVVWSVVSEPPAAGQPAEPAIRAVADVGSSNLRMTMTIRRNADDTLPASHVIEILFDTPDGFPGGEIENVQRLALKPTEQARGEPLIGVAGKISDGFFIIALNDLQQAVDSNLALMAREQWIDIPMAYANGQRALMSLEKGIPGERVFQETLDAWAASATTSAG